MEFQYILQPYKGMNTRYPCPSPGCGKGKTFSRYIDMETGEQVAPNVGRCNRESNCGYHYTPQQYFRDNNISTEVQQMKRYSTTKVFRPTSRAVSYIPVEIFKASLNRLNNHFSKYLFDLFGNQVAGELIGRYFIATSKYWKGATIFWQIDIQGKIRTGKIMLYCPDNGKRIKQPFNHITWAHKVLKLPDFELHQCLFGEHLLKAEPWKPVALVESEKTAIIASAYLPQFIWLATGSIANLNADKCKVLKGRAVILFPDLNGYEKWSQKAEVLSVITKIQVSDLLERKATESEKQQGLDIADYLVRIDLQLFRKTKQISIAGPRMREAKPTCDELPSPVSKQVFFNPSPIHLIKPREISEKWDIDSLKNFFSTEEVPPKMKLDPWTNIIDTGLFIASSLEVIESNNGNDTYLPYLERLQKLKMLLLKQMN